MNYTTIENELLAVVFALDKFRSYLIGSQIVVFTDQATLKYLMAKQDAKPHLIQVDSPTLGIRSYDQKIKREGTMWWPTTCPV